MYFVIVIKLKKKCLLTPEGHVPMFQLTHKKPAVVRKMVLIVDSGGGDDNGNDGGGCEN